MCVFRTNYFYFCFSSLTYINTVGVSSALGILLCLVVMDDSFVIMDINSKPDIVITESRLYNVLWKKEQRFTLQKETCDMMVA